MMKPKTRLTKSLYISLMGSEFRLMLLARTYQKVGYCRRHWKPADVKSKSSSLWEGQLRSLTFPGMGFRLLIYLSNQGARPENVHSNYSRKISAYGAKSCLESSWFVGVDYVYILNHLSSHLLLLHSLCDITTHNLHY